MKRNVGDSVDLGIERNEVIGAGDESESVANEKTGDDAHGADGDTEKKKDATNLLASRAEGNEHGDVARFIGDGHGKHDKNIETGDESNETDENGGDEFFETKRAKEGAVLFHPGGGDKALAGGLLNLRSEVSGLLRPGEAKLQDIDDIAGTGQGLRRGEGDKTPIFVVVVKARVENPRNTEAASARHQSERSEAALRAGEGNVIAGMESPFIGKLLADEQAFDAVGIGREVESARRHFLQRFIALLFQGKVNSLHHGAAGLSTERQQDGLINGGRDGMDAGNLLKFLRERGVIVDATGIAGMGKGNMGGDAEEAILKRFTEASVHGESDHERSYAGSNTDDTEGGDQTENRGAIRRP